MKNILKKIIIIVLCVLSHVSSIVTIITGYEDTIRIMSGYIAPKMANLVVLTNFILWPLSFSLVTFYICYSLSKMYRKKIGTHCIPCSFPAMWNCRVVNNNDRILCSVHQDIYHEFYKLLDEMRKYEYVDFAEAKSRLEDFLGIVHQSISKALRTDFTISVMRLRVNMQDNKMYLLPLIHYRSAQSRGMENQRSFDLCYNIQRRVYDNMSDYVLQSKHYALVQGNNKQYEVNSAFSYLLTHRTVKYWMSNDLLIDEENGVFYTSYDNFYEFCKSFAVFSLIPPQKHIDPNGIIVFESHKTGTIVEKECVSMFGYVAHLLYELIEELDKHAA